MRASLLLPIGVGLNFFGFIIVKWYAELNGIRYFTEFDISEHYKTESLLLLSLSFLFLIASYVYNTKQIQNGGGEFSLSNFKNSSVIYFLISFLLLTFTLYKLSTLDFAFEVSLRGSDQFGRGLSSALSRLEVLVFPTVVFYLLVRNNRWSRFVVASLFSVYLIEGLVYGDRRFIGYFLIIIFFFMWRKRADAFRKPKFSLKVWMFPLLGLSVLLLSYLARFGTEQTGVHIDFIFLRGLLTLNGISAINQQVLYYIDFNGGYLFGTSFAYYFLGLFIPSFFLYLLGSDEFYQRSSYIFNNLFNANDGMGYDFMMFSDFYWNFGYLGIFLFIIFSFSIFRFVCKHEKSKNDRLFGYAVLLSLYFIAGQRSDFGFFLKSFVYSALYFEILITILRLRRL